MNGQTRQRVVLVAPDKFRGTASAIDVVRAVAAALEPLGWIIDSAPMADGGEGTLDLVGGDLQSTMVTGPMGNPVLARWSLKGTTAIIEMAEASGQRALGGVINDPIAATTYGTGELIQQAIDAGAKRVIVGLGGSATTDGGRGAVDALRPFDSLKGIELIAITDVDTIFFDCARIFGPQKGATQAHIAQLEARLGDVANQYDKEFGIDVRNIPGSGAAGGLGGGLAALGAQVVGGFDYLAEAAELSARIAAADLVITGEGSFDHQSVVGKVVGGVIELARNAGKPTVVVAGRIDLQGVARGYVRDDVTLISLCELFGMDRAMNDTAAAITDALGREQFVLSLGLH